MIKKEVTYVNPLNDEEVTETLHFNLSKGELIELELQTPGGVAELWKRVGASQDKGFIYGELKKLLILAYGVKSADGTKFVKNDRIREEFEGSEAYSEFLTQLLTDTDLAVSFMNGIMPKDLATEVDKIKARQELQTVSEDPAVSEAPTIREPTGPKIITHSEAAEMDRDELMSGIATGKYAFG